MRNFFHILIGCTIMYTIGFLTGFTEFNISIGNIIGVTISSFVVGASFGFVWEWYHSYKHQSFFDFNDVIRTGVGSIVGGLGSLFFYSQTVLLILLILSAFIIFREEKK